jgi:hypothetical protein
VSEKLFEVGKFLGKPDDLAAGFLTLIAGVESSEFR